MSHTSPASEPLKDDSLRKDSCTLSEKKRPRVDDNSHSSEVRDLVRPRPLSWRPSAPVEPPLQAAQLRSIGVFSILNSPTKSAPPCLVPSGGDNLSLTRHQSSVPPSPSAPASHVRLHSSPTLRLASPSIHPAKRRSLSPGSVNRQILSPLSPTSRFVRAGGSYARKHSAIHSPLAQESRPGLYRLSSGSPLPLENATVNPNHGPETMAPVPVSVHSTPTFHSRGTSVNPTPTPSSQDRSPTTPLSIHGPLGRSSPAVAGMPVPQSAPSFANHQVYGMSEPVSRLPSVVGDGPAGDEQPTMGGTTNAPPLPGMIPCILDLKSGSSSQAEKRKANSDASRRFRNRKRNEMQMEQKITAQQDEIRKQQEALHKQAQEIRELMQQRDYYRSERDFYREHVTRLVPPGQLPLRPPSPHVYRSIPEREAETTWSAAEARGALNATGGSPGKLPASDAVSGLPVRRESWHNGVSYPVTAHEQQAKQLSQLPENWTHS
ncbi:hypothetical protein CNMCM8927_003050 [Aspergillus lentulus]|uniref:BZIP domain-containing protein n=1 Tax=Aspergillus lentulus TaxID=293939 RepID=A0AAN6BK53_ASPLE|nr:hypothetical protein CNMCM6069_003599 [Aspergillus lentulus]KAF4171156.1 hypothetical protein CNMCM8060_003558 [Aspergillus lentulus]KAF4189367.1 hypothetical protein CNMCM7927_008655 [Aspergillus lentulus]KAF4190644.1 hypothetical protein CNMCM8694_003158 [Aspergillus lentulus]KAF4200457.1 hypothetical protein CNMCM8927_003050 [Aspergillus lentulus]